MHVQRAYPLLGTPAGGMHTVMGAEESRGHEPRSTSAVPGEAAGLYRELVKALAEDAARRQKASQFGSEHDGDDGGR